MLICITGHNDAGQYNFIILPIGSRKEEWYSYYIEWLYGLEEPLI